MINESKHFFYRTPSGGVHKGENPPPPDGSTLLVAPGAQIEDALAKRYKIDGQLKAGAGESVHRSAAGEPLVFRDGGRAMAAHVLGDDDEEKKAVFEAAGKEDKAAGVDPASRKTDLSRTGLKIEAESKAVTPASGGVENKAVDGPKGDPATAATAPPKPAGTAPTPAPAAKSTTPAPAKGK